MLEIRLLAAEQTTRYTGGLLCGAPGMGDILAVQVRHALGSRKR